MWWHNPEQVVVMAMLYPADLSPINVSYLPDDEIPRHVHFDRFDS